MLRVGEVLEIKKAFKSNQKDEVGDPLPLGSILIRMWGQNSISGNVHHIWARPTQFNRRIPLIGEHVLVFHGPVSSNTDGVVKTNGYFYINPINSSDDLVLHQNPKLFLRQKENIGSVDSSIPKPGYTFQNPPKKIDNIQIYEADDIIESRFGSSIRLGSTVSGNVSVYEKPPTWQGSSNGDPLTILRVLKPTQPPGGPQKYTVEDLSKDESSIYLTTTQKLIKAKISFTKSIDSAQIPTYSKPQILLDSDRIVLNAKNDMAIINAKKRAVIASDKIYLQTADHFIDVDILMEWLKEWLKQYADLSSGTATMATPAGPTAVATNVALVQKLLNVDFNANFKVPK